MKKLTLAILLGCVGASLGGDLDKGFAAYESGDYATALSEFRPLAEQGHVVAQLNLGLMYEGGLEGIAIGVPHDDKTAVKWYTLAAEQGHELAQFRLGVSYSLGKGVLQHDKTALEWYTLAAEQGHVEAQYNLGLNYSRGKGVPQDYVYAHMWLNIAASQGDEGAAKQRERAARRMTAAEISAARTLARECVAKEYKGC